MEISEELQMDGENNAGSKWGIEADESVRTVDCLRGRLLAERLASRNANKEAEQLGNKLMELENQLKQEAKSRNRAERKLIFFLKKLHSMNISVASDGSEHSGLAGKTDISSPSSTPSSATQESNKNGKSENGSQNLHNFFYDREILSSFSYYNSSATEVSSGFGFEPILVEIKGQEIGNPRFEEASSEDFEEKNIAHTPIVEEFMFSETDENSEKPSHLQSNQDLNDPKMDEQSDICYASFRFSNKDGLKKETDRDEVDNKMALVAIDHMPQKNQPIDPEILNSTVKQVLDALRHAREQLQRSIEKRCLNMIRVG